MDYEKKYKELTSGNFGCFMDISNEYPKCNAFEKCIIGLRRMGWTYGQIQSKLGMPAKKVIRQVLVQWAPDLIDNSKEKIIKVSKTESELYNILSHTDQTEFESALEYIKLWIDNHEIWFEDEFGYRGKFHSLDFRTQNAYLILVKNNLL